MAKKVKKLVQTAICIATALTWSQLGLAAAIPDPASIGSVQPGRIAGQVLGQEVQEPQSLAPIKRPHEPVAPNPLGAAASKIKFKLNGIVLEGNHVYSTEKLLPLYKSKVGTTITVLQLQEIVQSITNYYRNTGYILSRAILPPQHVKSGVVHIRVVEGSIDQVRVVGHPKGAKYYVQALGNHINASKPMQLSVMERYLRIANEVPGTQVKAILEPSKNKVGASDINLATETSLVNGFFSYDNYGTRYIGPQQFTLGATLNSIFRSGDSTHATYSTTPRPKELKFYDLMHETPIGTNGMRLLLDGNFSATNPLYVLQGLLVSGTANSYTATLRYPLIRSRTDSLTIEGGMAYLDSYVSQLNEQLYTDHLRSLFAGVGYDFADRFKGANSFQFGFKQGLPILGATTNSQSFTTSRYGATSVFSKITLQGSRLQALFSRFTLFGVIRGQYSFNPLLSSEQYGYGGSQLGRGYDPAEIIGDRGVGGTLELRADVAPGKFLLQNVQYYVFLDAGKIWNLRNVQQGIDVVLSAMSTGFGARIGFTRNLSGNVMWAQPLTRKVQSLSLIGNGTQPRVFFNITASM